MKISKFFLINTLFLIILVSGCHNAANPYIKSVVNDVNEVYLREHITQLTSIGSRFSNHENSVGSVYISNPNAQAQKIAYLSKCLEDYGYNVHQSVFNVSPLYGGKGINLIAFKKGTVEPEKVLELGAHYDTYANPGADDNCSGVAGVLEAARILSKIPTEKSIRFCLYDLEEVGNHLGSKHHVILVKNKSLNSKDEIFDGIINLDMIGYATDQKNTQKTPIRIPLFIDPPRTGNFILIVGNFESSYLGSDFELAIKKYADDLNYFSAKHIGGWFADANRSDQASYWKNDLPAIMITDTGEFRSSYYHQNSDSIETLNFIFLSQVVKATLGTILEYAEPVNN